MGVYLGSNAVDMQGGFVTGGASGASLQSKTVSPSESAQTVKADNGYDGLSQVTVNAVSKTYVGSGVTKKSAATYTPGTSDQSIASGQYLNGTQTIKGDSNLTAANIQSDCGRSYALCITPAAVRLQKHLENIWREISLISILPEQKQNHKSIRTLCGL